MSYAPYFFSSSFFPILLLFLLFSPLFTLPLFSITAVRRMAQKWTQARRGTLSHSSPATRAAPPGWTARQSRLSHCPTSRHPWRSHRCFSRRQSSAQPARPTTCAPWMTCAMAASGWPSCRRTTKTRLCPSPCPPCTQPR